MKGYYNTFWAKTYTLRMTPVTPFFVRHDLIISQFRSTGKTQNKPLGNLGAKTKTRQTQKRDGHYCTEQMANDQNKANMQINMRKRRSILIKYWIETVIILQTSKILRSRTASQIIRPGIFDEVVHICCRLAAHSRYEHCLPGKQKSFASDNWTQLRHQHST